MSEHEYQSYYGRPIIREPVWKPEVPVYFFVGGIVGGSAILSLAARLTGHARLARTSLAIGAAGELVCPALLVVDLGRPERFLNMLRVFKPTSPMSVGSWILVASGSSTATAAACEVLGILPRVKATAEVAAAGAGAGLALYTATLISNTAVPAWHEARRELPFVFASSAAASAGAAATLLLAPGEAKPARRVAILGAVASELVALRMEQRLGFTGEPYRKDAAGRLRRIATGAISGGAALLAFRGRRSRAVAVAGSALVLGGELALRLSIFQAGLQSARDPVYTVRLQRERIAEREAMTRSLPE
jgi:Polysulphide reductase, NrfD